MKRLVAVMAVVLLAACAGPKARAQEWTPLHAAASKSSDPSEIRALIEGGVAPRARGEVGKLPFDLAKDNEALQGTDVYWRLHEARFE